MITQSSIFDVTESAIKQAESNANPEWKKAVEKSILIICRGQSEFTMDDVHEYMEKNYPHIITHDNRAMGAMIKNAAKDGWCKPTGAYRPSVRISRHRGIIAIWLSLLFPLSPM